MLRPGGSHHDDDSRLLAHANKNRERDAFLAGRKPANPPNKKRSHELHRTRLEERFRRKLLGRVAERIAYDAAEVPTDLELLGVSKGFVHTAPWPKPATLRRCLTGASQNVR